MVRPDEVMGGAEERYLQAVYHLADGQAKTAVSLPEIEEYLQCDGDHSEHCCDYWTRRGALEWPARGHVSLSHLGLAHAKKISDRLSDEDLAALKAFSDREPRVSIVIPVLNEAETIGHLVRLVARDPRILEVIVVDDGSIDGTGEAAAAAGAKVMMSTMLGKGASMEDGVHAASGDIILFLDGDLLKMRGDLVSLMVDPIIDNEADFVKAKFTRDAGRVTVLTARPLLDAFFPELSGFDQPLGGIVAARRSLLRGIRLENDYGVDVGLLIDVSQKGARTLQVDIGRIDHVSQSLEALGMMAKQVTRVIMDRAWRHERLSINQVLEMQELERRARASLLPHTHEPGHGQKFALFDMDGTLLDGRYILELAARVGAESDLAQFLDNRGLAETERSQVIASLFSGVPMEVFEETARSMPLMEGAVETVVALRKAGYRVGIVTDSYHIAAEIIRRRVFADFCVAHVMRFRNGTATGDVALSSMMIDAEGCPEHDCCKSNVIKQLCETWDTSPADMMAVGDGENDICMLRDAGLSVAFRPRSTLVENAADHTLRGPLLDLLNLVGGMEIPAETAEQLVPYEPFDAAHTGIV